MEYQRKRLINGTRLIMTPMPQAKSIGVNVVVGTGSRHEEWAVNGLSHFLEHMAFKGTTEFSNQKIISEKIEGLGGFINAYTSESLTSYHVKATPEHLPAAFAVVSQLALAPLIRPQDIDHERGVILEEIHRKEDDPQSKIFENISRVTFPDHPLGWPTLGRAEVIKNIQKEDFEEYRCRRYLSSQMVVSVAGQIDEDEVQKLFEEAFSSLSVSGPVGANPFLINRRSSAIDLETKETEQAHLALSVRGLSLNDPRRFALSLLNTILGSGMSSRLFLNIREKGLAYSVGSSVDLYPDTGALVVYAGFNKERVGEALAAVVAELRQLKTAPVSPEELKKAFERHKASLLFMLEDPQDVADWYGVQEVVKGKIETEEMIVEKLSQVTVEEIQSLANDFLKSDVLNLAVIGPYSQNRRNVFLEGLSL